LYTLRRVAKWRDLTWEYFTQLDPDDAAAYVAEYLTETELESHEAMYQARKQRRRR
jgi:hypothetical protein